MTSSIEKLLEIAAPGYEASLEEISKTRGDELALMKAKQEFSGKKLNHDLIRKTQRLGI